MSRYSNGNAVSADKAKTIAAQLLPTVQDLSPSERSLYSIRRAIRSLAGDEEAGLEREVSDAIGKTLGRPTPGCYVPTRLRAGLDTKTDAAGKYSVMTEVRDLIELLRNKTRVEMGATVLSGLSNSLAFPVQSSGSTGSWVAENPGSDVAASDAVFSQKSLAPKMYSGTTSFSRKLLAQSSIDVENFVRSDLATAHALAITWLQSMAPARRTSLLVCFARAASDRCMPGAVRAAMAQLSSEGSRPGES